MFRSTTAPTASLVDFDIELSETETAAVLRCRPGTVKSRLSRGLAKLREELA